MPEPLSLEERLRHSLREARTAAGLRQAELAELLGEPQSFVSKYENGERRLSFLEVRQICEALRIDFVAFVERFEHLT
jgi:transcriptional regulator with XRE-family HTH domain